MKIMLFAIPPSPDSHTKARAFFNGIEDEEKNVKLRKSIEEGSQSLEEVLRQVRIQCQVAQHKNTITVIGVQLNGIDAWEAMIINGQGDRISFSHSFVIAAGHEGRRIFYSYDPGHDMFFT